MRCVVDAQLPPALAQWLGVRGHDAVHVFDLDYGRAPDSVIWEHARETGSVIITKDEDFALRAQLRPSGPPVIWIRFGNVRRQELLRRLDALWPQVLEALARGEGLIELI